MVDDDHVSGFTNLIIITVCVCLFHLLVTLCFGVFHWMRESSTQAELIDILRTIIGTMIRAEMLNHPYSARALKVCQYLNNASNMHYICLPKK